MLSQETASTRRKMKMSETSQLLSHHNRAHTTDLFLRLNKLRKEELLCDLTILVQGQKFKAHKVVMAACSNYFLTAILGRKSTASVSITEGTNGSHMTVELQYITLRGFSPLLDYAYTSELNVNATDVIDVLAAASYMQMFDVARACSNFMRTNLIDTSNPSRLAGLQLLASQTSMMLNGQNDDKSDSSLRDKTNSFQEPMSSLLQATSALDRNGIRSSEMQGLVRPPVMLPYSSMKPFDVNFPPWTGKSQHLISHLAKDHTRNALCLSTPSVSTTSMSQTSALPNWKNHNNLHFKAPQEEQTKLKSPEKQHLNNLNATPPDENGSSDSFHDRKPSNHNNNNNNNIRDILDLNMKVSDGNTEGKNGDDVTQAHSDNEAHSTSSKTETSNEQQQESSPGGAKDALQNLRRLYNLHQRQEFNPSASPGSFFASGCDDKAMGTNSLSPSIMGHLGSTAVTKTALSQHSDVIPNLNSRLSMLSGLNGLTFHQHLLHRHLLAQQQQHLQQPQQQQESEKVNPPDLPVVPPSGQYMSVRRRTLQSNVPKPHQCQICGSRFTRYHNLKQHIKLHSGVKPYECDVCGKRFTRNYTLRLHKMKHIGVRNFSCGTCPAAFTSLGEFRAHLRLTMHSHLAATDHQNPAIQENLSKQNLHGGNLSLLGNRVNPYESALLNYGVGSPGSSASGEAGEGSSGTLSPPSNALHSRIGANNSPQRSNRPFTDTPQDLSIKRPSSDKEEIVTESSIRRASECSPPPDKKWNGAYGEAEMNHRPIDNDLATTTS